MKLVVVKSSSIVPFQDPLLFCFPPPHGCDLCPLYHLLRCTGPRQRRYTSSRRRRTLPGWSCTRRAGASRSWCCGKSC